MLDSVIRQYDKNKDGVIDKEEMAAMPSRLRTADRNGDGRITREEMTAYFMEFSRRGGGPPGGPSSSFGDGPRGGSSSSSRGGPPVDSSPAFQGGPGGYPPGIVSGSGQRVRPRLPSEPPDPRAPMVTIQAVLVELVQDEPGAAAKLRPGSPAVESRPAPSPRGKSEFAVIDLDLAAPPEAILAELQKLGVQGRLDVLNRVQMTTLDRQSASVQFGRHEGLIWA